MFTFRQYLIESTGIAPGNYASMDCEYPKIPRDLFPKSGKIPENNAHITLIYSEYSDVDSRTIKNLYALLPDSIRVVGVSVACFDSIPKEGEPDENKATLVLKVENELLNKIHTSLSSLGMQHSYPEFSPHVTLSYNVDREEAYDAMYRINNWIAENEPIILTATNYQCKPIDKNWVSKL